MPQGYERLLGHLQHRGPPAGSGYFSDDDLRDTVDRFFLTYLRGRNLVLPGETITQVLNAYVEAFSRINERTLNYEIIRLAMISQIIHTHKSDLKDISTAQERRIAKVAEYAMAIMDLDAIFSRRQWSHKPSILLNKVSKKLIIVPEIRSILTFGS